jgi:hypothetical protein
LILASCRIEEFGDKDRNSRRGKAPGPFPNTFCKGFDVDTAVNIGLMDWVLPVTSVLESTDKIEEEKRSFYADLK